MREIIYELEWTVHLAPHCIERARFATRREARQRFNELRKSFFYVKYFELSYERRLIDQTPRP